MKRTKNSVRLTLLLLLCLSLCAISFGTISASADDTVVSVMAKIDQANVAFNGKLQIAFTVEPTIIAPKDVPFGIAVWDTDVTEPKLENCKYVNFNAKTQNGYTYYKTREFNLSEIDKEFYVAACYKQNDKIILAEKPFKYSVEKFFMHSLAVNITEEQAFIYNEYLELAKNAGAADFTAIKANGGYVGHTRSTIGGTLGQNVILRADSKNGKGEYFLAWTDAEGRIVSHERVFTVKVENEGITEYTAIYGDKEKSDYSSTFDFEALESGYVNVPYPSEDSTSKVVSGYDSAKTPLFSGEVRYDGLRIYTYKSLKKLDDNLYTYSTAHDFYVLDNDLGGKMLKITNGHQARGCSATFTDIYESYATGAEMDIQYNTTKSGGFYYVNLVIVDKNGKSCSLRTNITTNGTNATFYAEGDGSAYPSVYFDKKIDLKRGNLFTIRAELNRDTESIDFYIDGALLQNIPLTAYATYKKQVDAAVAKSEETGEAVSAFDSESLTFSGIAISGISSTKDDITVDNVTFFRGEPIITDDENQEGAEQ